MDTQQVKSELHVKKAELASRVERTHRHLYQKQEPVSANFNDQVKQTENDDLVMALDKEGQEEIAMIDLALQRIEEGTYARCRHCGQEIGENRLLAIPYTDSCINCAS